MSKLHGRRNMRKARKKIKNAVLCSRDLCIMRYLFESKVASQKQIGSQFFRSASAQAVNKRLLKIKALGLIQRRPIDVEGRIIYLYSLTRRGLTKLQLTLPYQLKTVATSSECHLHDIALNDIRQALEAKDAVQCYYTENVLQTSTDLQGDRKFRPFITLNSDAMAEVDSRIGVLNLAIEFDMACKSKNRYMDKINAYYFNCGVDGVLYICADKYILHALFKADREVSERHQCDHKLYFALLNDVTGAVGEMTFRNASEGIFCVR